MISDTRQNPINNEVKKIIMWQIENVLLAEHLKYRSKKKEKNPNKYKKFHNKEPLQLAFYWIKKTDNVLVLYIHNLRDILYILAHVFNVTKWLKL